MQLNKKNYTIIKDVSKNVERKFKLNILKKQICYIDNQIFS